jgi:hypothetical protein
VLLFHISRYEFAEDAATEALVINPKFLKARYRRGLARKGRFHLQGVFCGMPSLSSSAFCDNIYIVDLGEVTQRDPNCQEAISAMEQANELESYGEQAPSDMEVDAREYELPEYDDDGYVSPADSDSSDCAHPGDGVPCAEYNHDGCSTGEDCSHSHAPDSKSIRDDLCAFFRAVTRL